MKSKKVLFIIITILIVGLLSAACSKPQATTAPAVNPSTTEATGAVTAPPVVVTQPPATVPEDVPIMKDAYDLEVPNSLNVLYKVNLQIKDVVAFYQTELPNSGWDKTNNPDSVVGSMAQLSRSKENGDRLTFSLQYNPVGEFTIVQIYITRVP